MPIFTQGVQLKTQFFSVIVERLINRILMITNALKIAHLFILYSAIAG